MLTSRLLLRPLQPADAPVIAAYRSDPDVARYQSWTAPFTNEDADMLINELVEADPAKPGWTQYGIELRSVGRLIGDLGVNLHRNRMQAAIGFTVAAAEQGHGYGPEAVGAMLDHLFTDFGLQKVSAECDARNLASARLLQKVGFHREGHLRSNTFAKGEWTDDLLFGLLADDWMTR